MINILDIFGDIYSIFVFCLSYNSKGWDGSGDGCGDVGTCPSLAEGDIASMPCIGGPHSLHQHIHIGKRSFNSKFIP